MIRGLTLTVLGAVALAAVVWLGFHVPHEVVPLVVLMGVVTLVLLAVVAASVALLDEDAEDTAEQVNPAEMF